MCCSNVFLVRKSNRSIMQVYLSMISIILINSLWLWNIQSAHGQGVFIELNGTRLSNNSQVIITDIGEGAASVHCITNKSDCCRKTDGNTYRALGEWYFPNNGSAVGIELHGGSFYRNRDRSVVRLHRRHSVMMPTGPFCCEVPDASGSNQTVCIIVQVASTYGLQYSSTAYDLNPTGTPTEIVTSTIATEAGISTSAVTRHIVATTIPKPFITGVYFQLNGASYGNNSRVNITDIGEGDNESLICVTNNRDCCKNFMGEWYFPNGSAVKIEGAGETFYRNRGQGVVRLHRRHNAMLPSGPFCCVVPDAMGIDQTACIIIEAMATVTDLVTAATERSTRGTTMIRPTESEEDNVTRNGLEFPTPTTTMKDTNVVTTDSTTHLFQLRLFEIQNCLEWVNEGASAKIEDILAAITSNINQHCQCGLSPDNITDGVFRCFSSSPQAVTFRALLHGAAKASSSEIISLIEQWISNDITVRVQSVLINLDSRCTVTISSFDDRECQVIISQQPINEIQSNTPAIIGGGFSASLLILLLASITIIIVLLLWLRKRRKVSLKDFRTSKNEIPMTEASLSDNTPHEYEVLDKYNREYEEIAQEYLTKCPAYVPTIHAQTGT